jgi:hypothetical protein
MGGPDMVIEELIAYVVLLSLPLWLLIEQLLFLRWSRGPRAPQADRRVAAPPFPEVLRSVQR